MKLFIFLISILFGSSIHAKDICADQSKASDAFNWSEDDFTAKTSKNSLKTLQSALNNKGSIGTCGLPNSLAIVQGYILKQQALEALKNDPGQSELITKFSVLGFCEFLEFSKPCE